MSILFKRKSTLFAFYVTLAFLLFHMFLISSSNGHASAETSTRFDYIELSPTIQKTGKNCTFTCIAYPSHDITSVHLVITNPHGDVKHFPMHFELNGKYTIQQPFTIKGEYYFFITLQTEHDGLVQSELYTFWIATSYQDKDSDGLPTSWEHRYGLNPEYKQDAYHDPDNDGYLTIEEYKMNTDPLNNNIIENTCYHLKEKQTYLLLSLMLCGLLCIFSWYAMRRQMI